MLHLILAELMILPKTEDLGAVAGLMMANAVNHQPFVIPTKILVLMDHILHQPLHHTLTQSLLASTLACFPFQVRDHECYPYVISTTLLSPLLIGYKPINDAF